MTWIRTYPWLVKDAVLFMDEYFKQKRCNVLEFGCGGSTIWMDSKVDNVTSIEHDEKWANRIKSRTSGECTMILANRPYYNVCDRFEDETFDFILVDGRDRVKCFENSLKLLKNNGVIMLDNAEREEYKEIPKMVKKWQSFEATGRDLRDNFGYEGWKTTWWIKNEV